MKKITIILLLLVGIISLSLGQAPQSFNYQAVARDASNHPYQNTNLGVRIRLLKDGISGNVEYAERHGVTTTNLGVFTLQIGKGTSLSGDFSAIDWSANAYYLDVAIDLEGGTNYIPMGSSQLLSVPYALYANQAGGDDNDNDPANEIQTLVYDTATQKLTISGGNTISLNVPSGSGEAQTLSLSGTTLTIENGNTVDLSVIQDGVNDADADSTNELQTLSVNGSSLSISGGNAVSLPNAASHWTKVGENLFYDSGSVNISQNLVTEGIFRLFPDSSQTPLAVIQPGSEGAGEIITRGPNGSINTFLSNDTSNANMGTISVHDQQGKLKVGLKVNSSGEGTVATDFLDAGYGIFNASASVSPIVATVDGNIKFQVHTNGGVSVGTPIPPTTNGLAVAGIVTANTLNANAVALSTSPTPTVDPLVVKYGQETKFKLDTDGNLTVGGTVAMEGEVIMEKDVTIGDALTVENRILTHDHLYVFGFIESSFGQITLHGKRLYNINETLFVDAHFAPEAEDGDFIYDLGQSNNKWRNIYALNGTIQTSDLREKKNIQNLNYGLKELMQLRPVRYEWKDKPYSDPKLGLIAQELLPFIPEVVQTHEWKYGKNENAAPKKVELDRLGVYYSDLIPVLIKAIQEQQQQIETQDQMIRELQQQVGQLVQKYTVYSEQR